MNGGKSTPAAAAAQAQAQASIEVEVSDPKVKAILQSTPAEGHQEHPALHAMKMEWAKAARDEARATRALEQLEQQLGATKARQATTRGARVQLERLMIQLTDEGHLDAVPFLPKDTPEPGGRG